MNESERKGIESFLKGLVKASRETDMEVIEIDFFEGVVFIAQELIRAAKEHSMEEMPVDVMETMYEDDLEAIKENKND